MPKVKTEKELKVLEQLEAAIIELSASMRMREIIQGSINDLLNDDISVASYTGALRSAVYEELEESLKESARKGWLTESNGLSSVLGRGVSTEKVNGEQSLSWLWALPVFGYTPSDMAKNIADDAAYRMGGTKVMQKNGVIKGHQRDAQIQQNIDALAARASGRAVDTYLSGATTATISVSQAIAASTSTSLKLELSEPKPIIESLTGLVYVYKTQADGRVRPSHAILHNTAYALDEKNAPVPPLGPNCRCYLVLRALDSATAKQTGVPLLAPNEGVKPGIAAFKSMLEDGDLSLADALGQRRATLIEDGRLKLKDVLSDETLIEQEALAAAKSAGSKARVSESFRRLRDFNVTPTRAKAIARSAPIGAGQREYIKREVSKLVPKGSVGIVASMLTVALFYVFAQRQSDGTA